MPDPKPPDKSGLKEWVKKHLQALGRALANLAGKAAAALPGIIGSIVSWLLSTLGKTATWLAENLWTLAIAVGTLHLVAARDWLSHSAVPPLTCRRCQLRCLSKAAAPCERSRLVRRSSLGMPYRLWRRSALPRLSQGCVRLHHPIRLSGSRCCTPGYCPDGVPCRSATDRA